MKTVKYNKGYIGGLLFLLFFSSCFSPEKHVKMPVLSPFDKSDVLDLSEVVDTVMYIQLDDSILLSGIGNLSMTDSFIIGTTKKYGILRFDLNGQFRNTIGHIGEGPEEYLTKFYNMAVDVINETVYVYMFPDVLLSYSLEGKFLERTHLQWPEEIAGIQYPDIFRIQNGLLHFYYMNAGEKGKKPLYWLTMTKEGRFINYRMGQKSRKDSNEGVLLINDYVNVDDSTMIYWDNYNDTIFHVTPSSERAVYLFERGKYRLQDTDELPLPSAARVRCSRIIDTKHFLILTWGKMSLDDSVWYNLYDKDTDTMYRLDENMKPDRRIDLSLRHKWMSYVRLKEREYLVTLSNAYQLKDVPGALRQGIHEDDMEGNPVIVLIRLKG